MRKNYLYGLILTICMIATSAIGQLHFDIANVTVENATTVDVEFRVKNYTNISHYQMSIPFDRNVLEYNSVTIHESEPMLNVSSDFGLASQMGSTVQDVVTVAYFRQNGEGVTLPDSTLLFSIKFNIVGGPGTSSSITIADFPVDAIGGGPDTELPITSTPGSVTVAGVNPNALVVSATEMNVMPGATFCMPITAVNFKEIQTGNGNFLYDKNVLEFQEAKNFHPAFANSGFGPGGFAAEEAGRIIFVYFNNAVEMLVTVPDNETLFELCFKAIGAGGTMSPIDLADVGDSKFRWSNTEGLVESQEVDGKVNIVEAEPENITFKVKNTSIVKGTTSCVDVTVEHFNEVDLMQFGILFDKSQLSFVEGKSTGVLSNIFFGNAMNSDTIILSWADSNMHFTVDDGTAIFQLCFEAKGDCDSTSTIDIGFEDAEVLIDGKNGAISPVVFVDGQVQIVCEPQCEIVRVDKACEGQKNGNIIVDIESDCSCVWTDQNNTQIASSSGADCNLNGIGAGTYRLVVTCPGSQPGCMREVVVEELAGISLDGTISYDGCTGLGAIKLSTSVTEGLSYKWTPEVNNDTNPTGLSVGTYTVAVTNSATNCVESKTFEIVQKNVSLRFESVTTVDTKCQDDTDGSITVVTQGGCGNLTYTWEPAIDGANSTATNLKAGTYKITITDESNPAVSIDTTVIVKSSSAIQINPNIVASDGNNGTITLNTTGGVEPYTFVWTGADNLPNSGSLTGLKPGEYRVTITDAVGCTFTSDVLIVPDPNGSGLKATASTQTEVLCHGDETGVIGGVIASGKVPVVVSVSGGLSKSQTFDALGAYKIENLPAGKYTLDFKDAEGNEIKIEGVEISEPSAINIAVNPKDITCDKDGTCNGAFKVDVSGGVEPYAYKWSNVDIKGTSAANLCKGTYTLVLTDNNGCVVMKSIEVQDCDEANSCYVADKVITPNGDGRNDVFTISCVQNNSSTLTVYDRWGQEVYKKSNYDNTWNGEDAKGTSLPESSYMWVLQVEFASGRTRIEKGTVTLLRD